MQCERCGDDLERIVAQTISGDEVAVIHVPCTCPSAHCAFCARRLDTQQRCVNLDCFHVGHIVPIPEFI